LATFKRELEVGMGLAGVTRIDQISRDLIDHD
jgi:isopentenyl diphosphate isomerase/L-lactate dehydrogenase-like FMN-dependent dehydrogenase